MNIKSAIAAIPALALLSGCATYGSQEAGNFDPADFGEANRMTNAAMIVNPDPVYDEPMETSGERAADAIENYRKGDVEEPDSQGIGGGSGGGGGASL